jgi:hypothetical protein
MSKARLVATAVIVEKRSPAEVARSCGTARSWVYTLLRTTKNWPRAQSAQPATLAELQSLPDAFAVTCNTRRPHRSLPHRATPATAYAARPTTRPSTPCRRPCSGRRGLSRPTPG